MNPRARPFACEHVRRELKENALGEGAGSSRLPSSSCLGCFFIFGCSNRNAFMLQRIGFIKVPAFALLQHQLILLIRLAKRNKLFHQSGNFSFVIPWQITNANVFLGRVFHPSWIQREVIMEWLGLTLQKWIAFCIVLYCIVRRWQRKSECSEPTVSYKAFKFQVAFIWMIEKVEVIL